MTTVLLVPIQGPLRVVPTDDVEALLAEYSQGRYVDFGVKDGDDEIGRIAFQIMEGPTAINLRARAILADLTGVHMVVTGTAAFTGLPDTRLQDLLAGYS